MEDASLLSLEYSYNGGVTWATIETNYFVPGKVREVTVIGSELSTVCDYNRSQYKIRVFANRHIVDGAEFKAVEGPVSEIESPPEEPLQAELRAFIGSVANRQPPGANGYSGYDAIRVLEAAGESAKSGRVIELAT
jgi:UDP-N-acetylglucosamine 3-dehydrogenase